VTSGIDQLGELCLADREAGGDWADVPGLFFEIPNELAAGALFAKLRPSFVNIAMHGPKRVRRTVEIKVIRCIRSRISGASVSPGPGLLPRNGG
jgi:hypothetical protein